MYIRTQRALAVGVSGQDWDEQDMKDIARAVPSKVYKDCQKEEPETVSQVENFGKMCSSVAMKYCREILNNR